MAEHAETLDRGPHDLADIATHHLQGHPLDGDLGEIDLRPDLAQHLVHECCRLIEAAAADLAFGQFEAHRQRQLVGALPAIGAEHRDPGQQVAAGTVVRRGGLRLASCLQVELRDPRPFLVARHQCVAQVQLVGDVEDPLGQRRPRQRLRQHPADVQMQRTAFVFRHERVGAFLDAVVQEAAVVFVREDDARIDGVADLRTQGSRGSAQRREGREVRLGPEAGQYPQDVLRLARQPPQPP